MRILQRNFEADLPHCVRNVKEKNVLLFKFLCNIFISVRIIKEMPGSVANGTPCIMIHGTTVEIIETFSVQFQTVRNLNLSIYCLKYKINLFSSPLFPPEDGSSCSFEWL